MKANGGQPLKVAPVGPVFRLPLSEKQPTGQIGALQSGSAPPTAKARQCPKSPPHAKLYKSSPQDFRNYAFYTMHYALISHCSLLLAPC